MANPVSLVDFPEIDRYESAVKSFAALDLDAERFTATRLQQGVYGQRQEGVNMIRIKVPGGRLSAEQVLAIADVTSNYAERDIAHITTRQDIQVHFVPLERSPAAMRRLGEAGLTTREACGNTIRNVSACPLSGVCPHQHTDVTKHLDGAVAHFLRNPLNQQLPRKFKISFSACETDCAQGMMHDMGVVAVQQEGRFGFKVLAGGGLGHKPREAIVVEPFVEEKDLLLVMEAVVALHNRYSDRVKRAKSRIKFLVDRFGAEGFVAKYREEFTRVKAALAEADYPKAPWQAGKPAGLCVAGAPRNVFEQKQAGLYVFPISATIGDLSSAMLRGIAALMLELDLPELRTTQDQNLMLMNVPEASLALLTQRLAALGLGTPKTGDDVVACPGTSTCRLGITSSTVLGPKLSGGPADLRIRVSGCHNGCAQPETGDIGIYGEGRRLHGKLIPHYQMYFGGDGRGGGALAIKGPSVPAARIESAVRRVQDAFLESRSNGETFFTWVRRHEKAHFEAMLKDLTGVSAEQMDQVARDHGQPDAFRVLQLGGGECAGVSQVQIGSNFFDAAHERQYRDALLFQRKYGESAKCAEAVARLIGDALLQALNGKRSENLMEIAAQLAALLPGERHFATSLSRFAENFARDEEELDDPLLKPLFSELDDFTIRAGEFCVGRGIPLDLTGALPVRHSSRPVTSPAPAEEVALQAAS